MAEISEDQSAATVQVGEQRDRVTRRDIADGNVDKITNSSVVPISQNFGGLRFDNAMQVAEAAKLMAMAGPLLPPWLQSNVGGCWAIIIRANELNISPLALANWSYITENHGVKQIGFMSGFYHAIVEARAPIKGGLRHQIIGEGDERRCKVWATFKGEAEPRVYTSETLAKLRPPTNERGQVKGSPLWQKKPELQLFYDASRDWARMHCPHVIAGLYTREELAEYADEGHFGADNAKDISPAQPTPRLRLGERRADRASELSAHTEAAFGGTTNSADLPESAGSDAQTADPRPSASAAPSVPSSSPPHPEVADGATLSDSQAENSAQADGGADKVQRTSAAVIDHSEDKGGAAQESGEKNSITDAAAGTGQPTAASNKQEPPDIKEAFRKGQQARRAGLKKRAVPPEYRDVQHSRHASAWMAGWQFEDDAIGAEQK